MSSVFRTETLDNTVKFLKRVMGKKEPVIEALQPYSGADALSDHLREWALQWIPDANTMVFIPITGKKGYLSLIIGIYKVPTILIENKVKVMQGIIHQVSIALNEANLYRDSIDRAMELSHKIETIQTMHEIDRAILSTLNSDEILGVATRILTVADTVDAMGADRPYRKGKPMDIIIAELKRCSGSHFDPKVVDVFLKVISET